MTKKVEPPPLVSPSDSSKPDEWGWEAHRLEQLRAALSMTPAERLAWLERTNASMRALAGLARTRGRPIGE